MAESEKELNSLLMKVKEESEKTCLKFSIQKMKIMAPVPSLDGDRWEKIETVADFIFLGSKMTMHRLQKYMNQNLPDLGWTVPAAMKLKDNSSLEGKR